MLADMGHITLSLFSLCSSEHRGLDLFSAGQSEAPHKDPSILLFWGKLVSQNSLMSLSSFLGSTLNPPEKSATPITSLAF